MLAEDCAAEHWAAALGGHRERAGWRADCPCCGADRSLEWDAPGKTVRWQSWCAEHDRDALRPVLAGRLGACFPRRRSDRPPVRHDDLIALALADMPPKTKELRMLQMAGMGTREALDKLGVRSDNRARVIGGRTGGTSKWTRSRRS